MLSILKHNFLFISIILVWLIFANTSFVLLYVVIPASLIILALAGRYIEMLLGMYLFMVVSDLRHEIAFVAQLMREIYLLSLVVILVLFGKLRPISHFYIYFIPFVAVALLSSLISDQLAFLSAQKTLSFLLMMIIAPTYVLVSYRNDKAGTLKKLVYFGFLVLSIGFVLKFVNPSLVQFAKEGGRYKGIFGNPNGLGIFCVMFTIVYLTISKYYPQLFSRMARYLIIGSIVLSVFLCESRGAIFSITILIFFSNLSQRSNFLSFGALVFMIISYQWLLANFEDLVMTFGLEDYFRLKSLETGSGRLVAFDFAWDKIQDVFFFGGGMGFTEYVFHAPEHVYYLSKMNHQGNAHNSFLTIWLDTGLFGLIAFLIGWGRVFTRANRFSPLAVPIVLAVSFSGFFESWLASSLNPFTIFLIIAMALLTHKEFSQGEEEIEMPKVSSISNQELKYA